MAEIQLAIQRPVIICGPSGSGKSTCIKHLLTKYPKLFHYCVSHTTRPQRPDELNGIDYYFVSREEFLEAIKRDDFIEYAIFSGHYYGTSKTELKKGEHKGQVCLLDMDVQGVEKIRNIKPTPIFIFIRPRNFATLEKRLRLKSTESEDRILQRLAIAYQEMQYGITDGKFDAVIVNDCLENCIQQVMDILQNLAKGSITQSAESNR